MFVEQINDLFLAFVPVFLEKDADKKKKLAAKYFSEEFPKNLAFLEAKLAATGTGHFVGDSMTIADVYLMAVADNMKSADLVPEAVLFAKYPKLAANLKRTRNFPAIAEWKKSQKKEDIRL